MRGNWVLSQERWEKKGALHGSHGKVVTSWARRPKELRSCVASQHQAQRLPAAPSLQEPPASLAVGVTGDQCEVCVNGHGDDAEDQWAYGEGRGDRHCSEPLGGTLELLCGWDSPRSWGASPPADDWVQRSCSRGVFRWQSGPCGPSPGDRHSMMLPFLSFSVIIVSTMQQNGLGREQFSVLWTLFQARPLGTGVTVSESPPFCIQLFSCHIFV